MMDAAWRIKRSAWLLVSRQSAVLCRLRLTNGQKQSSLSWIFSGEKL